jgi:hypothetical protein
MKLPLILLLLLALMAPAWAQQIGAGAMPLMRQRLGFEAGGYLNRGAGTAALVRYQHALTEDTSFELGAGGATGNHGARALAGLRQKLISHDLSTPGLYLRAGMESYSDEEATRRNAVGLGPLITQGFVIASEEVWAFLHPRAQLGIESTSDEFVIITGTSLGLNTALTRGEEPWLASVELDIGLQNAANAFMVGMTREF